MQHLVRLLAIAGIVAALAACSPAAGSGPIDPPASPSVDEATATGIVTSALEAFNAGDYAGWSARWDAAMKGAIDEAAFLGAREQILGQMGRYVSVGEPSLSSKTPGTFRWTFPVTFEKGTATFWVAFRDGSTEISGLRFE